MLKYYFSNGICFASEIEFPELLESSSTNYQVYIKRGKVPEKLENIITQGPLRQVSKDEFLLDIKDVARFLVKNNSEIIIDQELNAHDDVVRLYVLSTILGVVLHRSDILPLHASSIRKGNMTFLISGNSGAGKSTLALEFYNKGYEVLNDDISSVSFDKSGNPVVHPGLIRLKLWEEALENAGYSPSEFPRIREGINKYSFPIRPQSDKQPALLKAIFFIVVVNKDDISHTRLNGLELFDKLRINTFRFKLIKDLQLNKSHFKLCNEIAGKIPFYILSRPNQIMPGKVVKYIEQILGEI